MTDDTPLSVAQVAQRLGVSHQVIYKQINEGTFPIRVVTIGARRKVLRSDLDRFLAGEPVAS